jgi:hypothetical protein
MASDPTRPAAKGQYAQHVLAQTEQLIDSGRLAYHEEPGNEHFYVPGDLLVTREALPVVTKNLPGLRAPDPEIDEELGLARFALPKGTDVHEVVQGIRERSNLGPLGVGPHHVLFGAPKLHGCPGRPPSPGRVIDLDAAGTAGSGVLVAVLDTGQTEQSLSLPWVAAHVRPGAEVDLLDEDGDQHIDLVGGHGTFISGILAQVAPGAEVLVLAPVSPMGLCNDVVAARAVLAARKAGAALLNLSFGGYTDGDSPPLALASALGTKGDGPLAVAAAGNDGVSRPFFPAALPDVVAVAALDANGRRASFSNFGAWVDACAPGDRVLSAYATGTVATDSDGDGVDDVFKVPWAYWSGTSFAVPQVVGALAVRMSETGESAREARDALLGLSATRLPDLGARVVTSVRSHRAAAGRP